MSVQLSTAVRNGRLDSIETVIGTSPKLQIRSGAQPANCAASDAGTLLAELALPSDWLNAASGGTKTLAGTWSGTAIATATAAHWRIKDNGGTVTGMQGSITGTSGGGDIELSTTSIISGGLVSITSFTITDGNP